MFLGETQPMGALYLESTENKKQERLREVVSQWLNCRILSNLSMILTDMQSKKEHNTFRVLL